METETAFVASLYMSRTFGAMNLLVEMISQRMDTRLFRIKLCCINARASGEEEECLNGGMWSVWPD